MKIDVKFSTDSTAIPVNMSVQPQKIQTSMGISTVLHDGENGATFFPAVSDDGVISWTNDRELPNPDPVNIKGKDGRDGVDGYTPVKGVDYFDGKDGSDGKDGVNGKDGYTPVKGIDYFDGKDGRPGADGFSPTVSVSSNSGGNLVTITDKAGAKSFYVRNGERGEQGLPGRDGVPGNDGFSPVVSIWDIDGGHRVTITDKDGEKAFHVMDGKDGADGSTPVKGTDYYTEADKAEMVQAVISALPVYDGSVTSV